MPSLLETLKGRARRLIARAAYRVLAWCGSHSHKAPLCVVRFLGDDKRTRIMKHLGVVFTEWVRPCPEGPPFYLLRDIYGNEDLYRADQILSVRWYSSMPTRDLTPIRVVGL